MNALNKLIQARFADITQDNAPVSAVAPLTADELRCIEELIFKCSQMGHEVNSDDIDDIICEVLTRRGSSKVEPVSIKALSPPKNTCM